MLAAAEVHIEVAASFLGAQPRSGEPKIGANHDAVHREQCVFDRLRNHGYREASFRSIVPGRRRRDARISSMRVLFVNPLSELGGSERSLLDVLASLGKAVPEIERRL